MLCTQTTLTISVTRIYFLFVGVLCPAQGDSRSALRISDMRRLNSDERNPIFPLRFYNGFGDSYLHKCVQSSGPVFVLALCGELRGGNHLPIHLRGIKAE